MIRDIGFCFRLLLLLGGAFFYSETYAQFIAQDKNISVNAKTLSSRVIEGPGTGFASGSPPAQCTCRAGGYEPVTHNPKYCQRIMGIEFGEEAVKTPHYSGSLVGEDTLRGRPVSGWHHSISPLDPYVWDEYSTIELDGWTRGGQPYSVLPNTLASFKPFSLCPLHLNDQNCKQAYQKGWGPLRFGHFNNAPRPQSFSVNSVDYEFSPSPLDSGAKALLSFSNPKGIDDNGELNSMLLLDLTQQQLGREIFPQSDQFFVNDRISDPTYRWSGEFLRGALRVSTTSLVLPPNIWQHLIPHRRYFEVVPSSLVGGAASLGCFPRGNQLLNNPQSPLSPFPVNNSSLCGNSGTIRPEVKAAYTQAMKPWTSPVNPLALRLSSCSVQLASTVKVPYFQQRISTSDWIRDAGCDLKSPLILPIKVTVRRPTPYTIFIGGKSAWALSVDGVGLISNSRQTLTGTPQAGFRLGSLYNSETKTGVFVRIHLDPGDHLLSAQFVPNLDPTTHPWSTGIDEHSFWMQVFDESQVPFNQVMNVRNRNDVFNIDRRALFSTSRLVGNLNHGIYPSGIAFYEKSNPDPSQPFTKRRNTPALLEGGIGAYFPAGRLGSRTFKNSVVTIETEPAVCP